MLVPSTFTGWYRKMMMNAEIASEMTRSRTQTPKDGAVFRAFLAGSLTPGGLPVADILSLILYSSFTPDEALRAGPDWHPNPTLAGATK